MSDVQFWWRGGGSVETLGFTFFDSSVITGTMDGPTTHQGRLNKAGYIRMYPDTGP